ncbi:hypothetical protein A2690_01625 [Candidatus Roizmanbacteria bacterium RIFCSPHIGHO2_01_FULL_39_12b]|uniref:Addiction module toxin RelE n=1 Tax=Candidatus Roizmanbacteria bacterium RIFCSPHIGHO2_01_FULL_39_12b TaxID=1802030 RepID=A0A1F7GB38_9BACT|nr:MAG: hypothetical protein A2690_01625 [Candidatus Roizmanbacteria bacterium RIFCSPHIGHO2_01_FULL_39_12b]OGK46122.1 MAG: hypothetical protein A3B46_02870 [Candidatus Roizmanbacteria bacterium RIFCSPLOWO2_01_FULL_39_19]
MYEVRIYKKAQKEIKRLPGIHQKAIIETLADIQEDPSLGKSLARELSGKFSYKIGVYRIIYKINKKEKIVQVVTVGHRANVYNN